MEKIFSCIDAQISFNKGKNIFFEDNQFFFTFNSYMLKEIKNICLLNNNAGNEIIDYTTDKVLQELYRINQYYYFNSEDKVNLRFIYSNLLKSILSKNTRIDILTKKHQEALKSWLHLSNPFAEKLYINTKKNVKPVACSEYSALLQLKILNINLNTITEPVLDIGCGKQGILVKFLNKNGIKTIGIDRFISKKENIIDVDWLEYEYGTSKWGTIISHLGFSNHFIHHNLRVDGNYQKYGETYMNILQSLKKDGSFHYAPELPFIELYLPKFQFIKTSLPIEGSDLKTSVIKKII
ncbi:MAG: class I SAM-dependent methyltransferase [Bacteroidales bacterium]|nr:class I SAM-dependent methyltransferase [Bacteroidales bacterium]